MQAATQGQWSASFNFGVVPIHAHLLPNGKVLAWDVAAPRLWDPATGTLTTLSAPATTNVFCSGHAFLPDGRLLVTGGHKNCNLWGEPHANLFDYTTNAWAARDSSTDMNDGRWYPSNCALGNGEMLVVSGTACPANAFCNQGNCSEAYYNLIPQVWQLAGGWRTLTGASQFIPAYPWLHQAPDGRVFYSGPGDYTRFLTTTQPGAWSAPSAELRTKLATERGYGSSVWYDDYKVLLAGGGNIPTEGNQPTNTAEVINLRAGAPQWRFVGSLANRRIQMNATVLPDGKVLATGGTSGAGFNNPCGTVLAAELWDPVTETWTTMASAAMARIYHSTALLLPDGRVLSAGSTAQSASGYPNCSTSQPSQSNAEIYSPPYLFNPDGSAATRPSISSAPTSIGYGQTFAVDTPDAANIKQVTMVRLSSVTHSANQNQRFTRLNYYHASGSQLSVTAPVNGNLCPPGHYMLFILNSSGVPSVAKIVQLSGSWLTPASQAMLTSGGASSVAVTVTSASGSNWTAVSNASWISVTSGGNGSGNGTVSYTVAANTTGAPRNSTISIAGVTFTVFQAADFTDVPTTHPFYAEISKLYARGITSGCGAGLYCPDTAVTRDQAAVLIERALGVFTPPTPTYQRFTDVPPTSFAYTFIDDLAFRRITNGCAVGLYCPTDPVTRAIGAILIERASGIFTPPMPASQRFTDVPLTHFAYSFIDDLAARGITLGCGTGLYCPDDNLTRAQMAAFLVRAFGL